MDRAAPHGSSPNAPQDQSILRGVLSSWCHVYGLRFAVEKIIHHDNVMCSIVIWPRRSVAARNPHSGDTRIGEDDSQEGKTSVARRGCDKAAVDQASVGAEALDARTRLTVSVFISGTASIRQVNVREDRAEAAHLCRHSPIGAGYEEVCLSDVAVHWREQALRAEGAKAGAVGRIVEERRQAALGPTRRGSLREAGSCRCELGAARIQERVERRDRRCRRIDPSAVPVDLASTVGMRPVVAIVVSFQGYPVLFDRVLNRGDVWTGSLEHGRRHEISAGILCASHSLIAAISATHQGQSDSKSNNQPHRFQKLHH